ncbi:bifunctional homocysteine S-methyltransferase/methylenetetrahydrofolate reductase [Heyndrickxia sp. NPDC080065]|uniref:bifunctional homocysteine S-methyltransferase/methylenetetrahydrofolate reductase n=1 Tax=Heyndrickxia sp. NPDC080065 TaxID=3390568 RepID=UPI003D0549CE
MNIKERLKSSILVADGAMGTLLYSYGKDTCYEEFNLSHPEDIYNIHKAYIQAGAQVIQTNTYGANYFKLGQYGLEEQVKAINVEAVRIAKKAATGETIILGSFGGYRGVRKADISLSEIKRSFREQLFHILNEGVDGILLETFYDVEELFSVVEIAKLEIDIPVIAQFSLLEPGVLQNGLDLKDGLKQLEELGADIVGLNCRLGPHHMIQSLEEVPLPNNAYLSAYPNASLLDYEDGRFVFTNNAGYFKECAVQLVKQGVRLIGGCCGTTPEHIKAISEGVRGLQPITQKVVKPVREKIELVSPRVDDEPPLHEIVRKRTSIIVELDTPKHLQTDRFIEGAKALKAANIDAITMADNSLASPRMSNVAMGTILKEQYNIRPLVHITCRDRNLIGLQSHLMGLDALGINQVLAVTGDPSKIGDFPGATSVYDVSSMDLIQMIKQFNEGISYSGKSLRQKASFSVAAAFNPNVRNLDRAVGRLEKKIKSGADYFITQPLFSEEKIIEVYEATKHLDTPIYIGIMPLTSYKNANFLHHEVPGISLTDSILETMEKAKDDPIQATRESLAISKSLIDTAMDYFNGIYLITPFVRYDLTVECSNYIHEKEQVIHGTNVI